MTRNASAVHNNQAEGLGNLKKATRGTHHIVSVNRLKNSGLEIRLHEAQAIPCNHFRMWSFYSPFHFPLILWVKEWHLHDCTLAEIMSISSNVTAIAHHIASQLTEKQ